MNVNRTLVEEKKRRFKGECAVCPYFSFKKCPIYTHDGASAKFSTEETDNGAAALPHNISRSHYNI